MMESQIQRDREWPDTHQHFREPSVGTEAPDDADGEFLNVIAHEVKGPLTNMAGYVQLLLRQPGMPEERRTSYLRVVLGETRRLSRLINDLVDASQFEHARTQLSFGPSDLSVILQNAVDRTSKLFPGRTVLIQSSGPVHALWDAGRIEDVLFHVISNALRYATGDEPVEVTVDVADSSVVMSVADRGPGIPEGALAAMHRPFYRVPRAAGGDRVKGLGLYLTREIVEAHGGNVQLESRPGGGTIVRIRLPQTSR